MPSVNTLRYLPLTVLNSAICEYLEVLTLNCRGQYHLGKPSDTRLGQGLHAYLTQARFWKKKNKNNSHPSFR